MTEHHDNENPKCPLNDPETFAHPATRGLQCTCEPAPEPATEDIQAPGPPENQSNWPRIVPNLIEQLQADVARLSERMEEMTVAQTEMADRYDERDLQEADEVATLETDLQQLAQASLDLIVGFRIRASGARIQVGVLEHMLRVNDLETAQAISIILHFARRFECQGMDLLTPFDETDDLPSGGVFGPAWVDADKGSVLEGGGEQEWSLGMEHRPKKTGGR